MPRTFAVPPEPLQVQRERQEAEFATMAASGDYSGERDAYRLRLSKQRGPVVDPGEVERVRRYVRNARRRKSPRYFRCGDPHCMGWHVTRKGRCHFT